MFSVSAVAGRLSARKGLPLCGAIAVSLWMVGMGSSAMAEPASAPRDFSGWRGGIGITFSEPARDIADVTEMGYEIAWGGEEPRAIKALGVSVFRYWNSIVETSLKGSGYDFRRMSDKNEAARLAFDVWMERAYGIKGLSKYAHVRYDPEGSYGDVSGSMDLSSENELVKVVIAQHMHSSTREGIAHGGIGLDNAGKVPREFLEVALPPAERPRPGHRRQRLPGPVPHLHRLLRQRGLPVLHQLRPPGTREGPARHPGRVHHAAPFRRRDGSLLEKQALQRHRLLRLHQWRHGRRRGLLDVLLPAGCV